MTPVQRRWWNRFKKTLREMPEDLELNIRNGSVAVCHAGAREACFAANKDTDNIDDMEIFHARRVYPNGESQ